MNASQRQGKQVIREGIKGWDEANEDEKECTS